MPRWHIWLVFMLVGFLVLVILYGLHVPLDWPTEVWTSGFATDQKGPRR